jgi:hypothetical protein
VRQGRQLRRRRRGLGICRGEDGAFFNAEGEEIRENAERGLVRGI